MSSKPILTASLLLALPLVAGCVASPGDPRPPLSECDHGLYWAECGGTGEPVLGCDRETGDCRWFAGGETARGYAVSDCPITDACCHEQWPFTDFAPTGEVARSASAQLSLLRWGVISRPVPGTVTVQDDLTRETDVGTIRCITGVFDGCNTSEGRVDRVGASVVLTAGSPWGSSGTWHLFEVAPGEGVEGWSVRLYQFHVRNNHGAPPRLLCEDSTVGLAIPVTGVLHVNATDTTRLEDFHAVFEGTTRTGVQFTMEL